MQVGFCPDPGEFEEESPAVKYDVYAIQEP